MDKFAQEQARDAYLTVRDELIKLGYTIYDQSKDGIYIGSMLPLLCNFINCVKIPFGFLQLVCFLI